MAMLDKFLCWIGRHNMAEYVMAEREHHLLIGHRCKRCHKVARGQEGQAELAQIYNDVSFLIPDDNFARSIIIEDRNSETKH